MLKRFLILMVILCLMVTPALAYMPEGIETVAYEMKVDYLSKMYDCAKDGSDYALGLGAIYEAQRNLKISSNDDLDYETTDFFTSENTADEIVALIEKYKNPQQEETVVEEETQPAYTKLYTDSDAIMLAKVTYCEARGIRSGTELACVMWTILNRVDAGYASTIRGVILAPNQFAYSSSARTVTDYGRNLVTLAYDVLDNWSKEKAGRTDYVRVLPKGYCWYSGDGSHNYFRNAYQGGTRWNYAWGYYYG